MRKIIFILQLIACFGLLSCFDSKSKEERELEKVIKELHEHDYEDISKEKEEPAAIDSTTIEKLNKDFNYEIDEFDTQKGAWVKPKSAPKFVDVNAVYFYFYTSENKASNLRLRFQYTDDDWLFIKKYIFNIDGFPIEFSPTEVKRDNKGGRIWEWSDDKMSAFEASLIDPIRYCKSIKVKIVGSDYEKVKNIPNKEVEAMKKTLELYEAMGGGL